MIVEFRISYYGVNGELLDSEILNYGTVDMAQKVVTEQLADDFIEIKKQVHGREERIVIVSEKVAKVTIQNNVPREVQFKGF